MTYNLHGDLVQAGAGRQQLFGHSFSLGQVVAENGARAVLIDDHRGSRVDVGSVQDRLPEFLHVPGRDRLRICQLCCKNLEEGYQTTLKNLK